MSEQHPIDKKIKRHIYGTLQSILVIYPPGLSSTVQDEVEYILSHLWFQSKFSSKMTALKNALRIDQIHLFAVIELLMRGQCFSDIRLIIDECKTPNMSAFEKKCREIIWEFYLNRQMSVKLKVDAGASPALHEGAIKELLTQQLTDIVDHIKTSKDGDETTTLYVDTYQYHSTISISLAGAPLYKRGYRSILSASAPLREDIAACCIRKAMRLLPDQHSLFVPFSGTGTFLFEYWIMQYQFAPALFDRGYAIQSMPLFRLDHFNFILKKAHEHCLINKLKPNHFYCVDQSASANKSLLSNIENMKRVVTKNMFSWHDSNDKPWVTQEDFFNSNIADTLINLPGNIFIPINPPYGIRFGNSKNTTSLYKQIADQLNQISVLSKDKNKRLAGFILCPSEESWSAFCKTLTGATIDTYHLTQGGLDIRIVQFII